MKAAVRPERAADHSAVDRINRAAFRGEGEAELVRKLRGTDARIISLVAEMDGEIAGHILFTPVLVEAVRDAWTASALGPMAVAPVLQRRGIGGALVTAGIESCREAGEPAIFVLGHSEYYPRFGFRPAGPLGLHYEGEENDPWFFALELAAGALRRPGGMVRYLPEFAGL